MPLSSASPSLGPSVSGKRCASASAWSAGIATPSTNDSPTPSIAAVMCASGARSPDAPTEPCAGTTGVSPLSSIASISATVAGCTPEAPRARLASLSAIISRATGTGIGSPTPAAWLSTMLRWSVARSSPAMRTVASFPKPVLIP